MWYPKECPDCEGEGIIYHLECEYPCEHDILCPKCKGKQFVPARVEYIFGMPIYPTWMDTFRTKKECQEYISYDCWD